MVERGKRSVLAGVAVLLLTTMIAVSYLTVPLHRERFGKVDALLVLGSPTLPNGYPSDEQRWRVDEAVREYRHSRAQYLLMSGGAVANEFSEAGSMAEYAESQGVPAAAILEEGSSRNTVENVRNSERMLLAKRWRRIEVISTGAHLHRAALFLSQTSLDWQTREAPTPGWRGLSRLHQGIEEVLGTTLIRWAGVNAAPALHQAKVAEVGLQLHMDAMAALAMDWKEWVGTE